MITAKEHFTNRYVDFKDEGEMLLKLRKLNETLAYDGYLMLSTFCRELGLEPTDLSDLMAFGSREVPYPIVISKDTMDKFLRWPIVYKFVAKKHRKTSLIISQYDYDIVMEYI